MNLRARSTITIGAAVILSGLAAAYVWMPPSATALRQAGEVLGQDEIVACRPTPSRPPVASSRGDGEGREVHEPELKAALDRLALRKDAVATGCGKHDPRSPECSAVLQVVDPDVRLLRASLRSGHAAVAALLTAGVVAAPAGGILAQHSGTLEDEEQRWRREPELAGVESDAYATVGSIFTAMLLREGTAADAVALCIDIETLIADLWRVGDMTSVLLADLAMTQIGRCRAPVSAATESDRTAFAQASAKLWSGDPPAATIVRNDRSLLRLMMFGGLVSAPPLCDASRRARGRGVAPDGARNARALLGRFDDAALAWRARIADPKADPAYLDYVRRYRETTERMGELVPRKEPK